MDVKLPDGTVVRNVPEGTTQSQLLARVEKMRQNQAQQFEQQPRGFIERTGQALGQRAQNIGESVSGTESFTGLGGQGWPETAAQIAGQGIGAAGDVLGNLAISGYRMLPEPVKQGLGAAATGFGNLPAGFGGEGTIAENIPQEIGMLSDKWSQFKEESPRAARNVAALGNIASVMPLARVTKSGAKTLENTADVIRAQADNITKNFRNMTADQIKRQSTKLYDDAAALGGRLKPKFIDDVLEKTMKEIDAPTEAGRRFAGMTKDTTGQPIVDKAYEAFSALRKSKLSLDEFDDIDKQLTQLLKDKSVRNEAGELLPSGQRLKALQEKAREAVLTADSDLIEGGSEGFAALKAARDAYRTQVKMREIENILEVASTYQQPSTAIKRRLANLATGKKGKMLYTPDERKALLKASETGSMTELLNAFGSRLSSPVAIGSGSPALGAGLRAASAFPRGSAEALQARQAQNVIDMIGRGGAELTQGQRFKALGAKGLEGTAAVPDAAAMMLRLRAPQLTTLGTINQEQ